MGFWDKLLSNEVLISAIVGWTVAQILKTLIDFGLNKSFTPERLCGLRRHAKLPLRNGLWADYRFRTVLRGGVVPVCHQLCTGCGGYV